MQGKLPELENLLVSRSGRTTSNYKTATFAAIGIYLIGGTLWRYYSQGVTEKILPNIILGFASFFALNYRKLVYLSPIGMVKETHTWITHHREVMKWEDIKFITLMHKGGETMVFLERDTLGWKVLFERDQVSDLKKFFKQYIPDIEINEMNR
ncbi:MULTISPECIES: hypothetical protein [Synergistaceae]|uniref:hypothetical protein n=1 Tax=Synergistaceae TaxID=649777 RepID=UPI0016A10FCE|nr:hypothetical protein [Synergistaceae bacterium DZ-S4]NLL40526.1 hypothetical protein [Synergistaceae bacterium]